MFKILWAFDAIVAAVFVYFFLVGLGDGSVSSFNIVLWMVTLGILGGVVGGSLLMRSRGRQVVGTIMLALLAVPSLLMGLFFLVLILSNPDWR